MFPDNLLGNVARQSTQRGGAGIPIMPPMPSPQQMNGYYQRPVQNVVPMQNLGLGLPNQRMNLVPNVIPMQRPMNLGNSNTATLGGFQQHMINLREEERELKPDNTNFAYDPKQEEFIQFCDYAFPSNPSLGSVSSTVTPDKVFQFLYYVSRRGKRKTKKKKDEIKFDKVTFELVRNNVNWIADDPVGESTMKQYHGAIIRLWQRQLDTGANNYTKEQIMSENSKFLLKSVRQRKARVEAANCVEKNTFTTKAFEVAKRVPEIEEWMWMRQSETTMYSMSSLRHRYFMLKTHNAILRGESLFKTDLSDMCGVEHSTGT